MKTQISNLRSGKKNQVLNANIDYSNLPKSTSSNGHSGSNQNEVEAIWNKVIAENPEKLTVVIKGVVIELQANWSLSRKSCSYSGSISKEDLQEKFFVTPAKDEIPYITIECGNLIMAHNGKNSFYYLCPSLVEIQ